MKTIGLLGGMSWESTAQYYRILNETAKSQLGPLHSAPIMLGSVDFHHIQALQHAEKWDELTTELASWAVRIEAADAGTLLICSNTMHAVYEQIQSKMNIPVLHIADSVGKKINATGVDSIALLGTRFTMEKRFYRDRLKNVLGIDTIIPNKVDRETVHTIIYEELCQGMVSQRSKSEMSDIISRVEKAGAGGILLGCTELDLVVDKGSAGVPIFDSTKTHCESAFQYAIS